MATNPFAGLPSISFANCDVDALKAAIVTAWEAAWFADTGEQITLGPSSRIYHFLLSLTGFFVSAFNQIDYSAKQNLLPLSSGGFLDNVCAIFGNNRSQRLPAAGASCQVQFTLPGIQPVSIVVPKGTQVGDSSGAGLIFATNQDLVIPAGQTIGAVDATCTTTGSIGNLIPTGSVNVFPVTGWTNSVIPTAASTESTAGGSDAETDKAYAIRMFGVTDSYSNAGSYGAYAFFAQSADPSISQVTVSGPEEGLAPGNVKIAVLCQNGAMPNSSVLSSVYNTVNADTIRDLCANVSVIAPTGVPFTVNVSYYIPAANANNVVAIQNSVDQAVGQFVSNVTQSMNTNIDPSVLTQLMVDGGGVRVSMTQPSAFTKIGKSQIGVITADPVINYLGTV